MSNATSLIRPTVFLDTNALHSMSTYLLNAKKHNLPPYTATPTGYEEVRAVLKKYLPKGIVQSLMRGCRTLAYLESEVSEGGLGGAEVYTSRLSRLEVLHGVLDGQAHAQMARTGIPYRMRQRGKNLSELVSMYLKREDCETLAAELERMFLELESRAGITIGFAEDEKDNLPAIIGFAELLQKNVFLDVIDCWMYGCALVVQADLILTFDDYFRTVVNRIHNPEGDEDWLRLQEAVRDELARLSGVSTAVELSLPEARKELPEQIPRPW